VSRARLLLHVAALIAPFAAATLFAAAIDHDDAALAAKQTVMFGAPGAIAAEIAAWLRWPALDRRAHEGSGGWQTGIGMALITHVLFAVIVDAALLTATGWREGTDGSISAAFGQTTFFFLASIGAAGVVTLPFTTLLAQWIAARRREEIADGAR
jgi:hypothetical protein